MPSTPLAFLLVTFLAAAPSAALADTARNDFPDEVRAALGLTAGQPQRWTVVYEGGASEAARRPEGYGVDYMLTVSDGVSRWNSYYEFAVHLQ